MAPTMKVSKLIYFYFLFFKKNLILFQRVLIFMD